MSNIEGAAGVVAGAAGAATAGVGSYAEGEGTAEDFAWFPAWALIPAPHLATAMRLAHRGADTPPERGAWQLLGLLSLERHGRQTDLIEGRRKLRALHPHLFDLYMRTR